MFTAPQTFNVAGWFSSAPKVSSALTAYPSTVDLLKGGISSVETASSARTRLYASSSGISSVPKGLGLRCWLMAFFASSKRHQLPEHAIAPPRLRTSAR